MIEISIKKDNGHELAFITLENVTGEVSEFGEYSVRFGIDTSEGVAVYQRRVDKFPRKRYNVLGLLRIALETLEEKELTLDSDPDARHSSNLARRLPRTGFPF